MLNNACLRGLIHRFDLQHELKKRAHDSLISKINSYLGNIEDEKRHC